MKLQVDIIDLRRMLKEKCEEIISDKKLTYEFYCRMCEIEVLNILADQCRELALQIEQLLF